MPGYPFVPPYCTKLFNWVSLIVHRHRKEHRPLLASIQATMQYQIQFPSKRQAAVEPTAAPEINEDLHQGKALVWDGRFLPNKRPLHQEQRGPWKATGCSERMKWIKTKTRVWGGDGESSEINQFSSCHLINLVQSTGWNTWDKPDVWWWNKYKY